MVKIGGAPREDRWNKLSREELKTLSLEINLEKRKIISDMDAKIELLTNESAIHEWYNLVSYFERKIKVLRDCFPPYSAEIYRSREDFPYRDILREFKEFIKRMGYKERYLELKTESSALEGFISEKASLKRKHEECEKQLAEIRKKNEENKSFLDESKITVTNLTSTIVSEKKAMQRETSQMKRNQANAIERLSELKETLKQKQVLLAETIEQRQKQTENFKKEVEENSRLKGILNEQEAK